MILEVFFFPLELVFELIACVRFVEFNLLTRLKNIGLSIQNSFYFFQLLVYLFLSMGLNHVLHPLVLFRPVADLPNDITRSAQEHESGNVKIKYFFKNSWLPNVNRFGAWLYKKLSIEPVLGFLPKWYWLLLDILCFYEPI